MGLDRPEVPEIETCGPLSFFHRRAWL